MQGFYNNNKLMYFYFIIFFLQIHHQFLFMPTNYNDFLLLLLQLPGISPGSVSTIVAPVLLKYRVCRPRLLLAGSRAEVDPSADLALLHGEVLLIEDAARQFNPIGGQYIYFYK